MLDHGAAGVLVPRVQGAEDAASAVAATRYAGARGLDPGSRASAFGRDAAYAERADDERVRDGADRDARRARGGRGDRGAARRRRPVRRPLRPRRRARRDARRRDARGPGGGAPASRTPRARGGKAAAVFLGDPGLAPRYRELGFTLISAGFTSTLLARRHRRDPAALAAVMLRLVRVGLPAAIAAAGVVLLIVGETENDQGAGVALIGVALVVMLLNLVPPPGRLLPARPRARGGRTRALRPDGSLAGRRSSSSFLTIAPIMDRSHGYDVLSTASGRARRRSPRAPRGRRRRSRRTARSSTPSGSWRGCSTASSPGRPRSSSRSASGARSRSSSSR